MNVPKVVIVEVGVDGVRAVYADDPEIRLVLVDRCWDEDAHVMCPVQFPSRLDRCPETMRTAAEKAVGNPSRPMMVSE